MTSTGRNKDQKSIPRGAFCFLPGDKKQKNFFGNLYICIFGKTDNSKESPKDVLFINLSNINDNDIDINNNTHLFQEIFNLIDIDNIDKWIKAGAVAVGTGGSLTAGAKKGDYELVTNTAKSFVEAVKKARE